MKRYIAILACVFLFSCAADKVFVKAVDGCAQAILPEYKTYIQKDTTLDAKSKQIRTQTADELRKLIDQEKARK